MSICSYASRRYVAYLWLDWLLGVIPGIVDVIEVIHSIVVCTAHMVHLQFIEHVIGQRDRCLLGTLLAIE